MLQSAAGQASKIYISDPLWHTVAPLRDILAGALLPQNIITYVPRRGAIGSKPIFLYKCVALLGLLWGCCGPLGALKGPLGAQEGSPGPLGGAQCPAGGRSILDRSLIDPKVAESVFAGDVEQNVVG